MKPKPTIEPQQQTVLDEAAAIVNGERRSEYGDAAKSFEKVAVGWSQLTGHPFSPHQVALCMIWLKLCREAHKPKRDSLVDVCGYAYLASMLADYGPEF